MRATQLFTAVALSFSLVSATAMPAAAEGAVANDAAEVDSADVIDTSDIENKKGGHGGGHVSVGGSSAGVSLRVDMMAVELLAAGVAFALYL